MPGAGWPAAAGLERRLLQACVLAAGIVPVAAGLWGAFGGVQASDAASDSHTRYLSGLLLGIGLSFWGCVPGIEGRGAVVRTLTALVVVGGLCRLLAIGETGAGPQVIGPLVMELGVTPLLACWRERIGRTTPLLG
ncbi:DUF4345 family protein [Phenylobacterium sp.]|jgi:hypothetical protein|uniref:DUF4345 family protein n=1 Tax=Phenylobacterium sp. TaxID=1871053 RepID=UPI002E3693A0|nr:DUF4345 family protein [Phenylobacterium sp.]HEX2558547.1 DUF4345 family protein [Phenylobacterium sp.]